MDLYSCSARWIQNFIIVGTQRTGSSALARFINCHPKVACGWEWTQKISWPKKVWVAEQALSGDFSVLSAADRDHMSRMFNSDHEWLGFRRLFRSSDKWILHPRFSPALWMDRLEDHISWLGRRSEVHIIHIVRGNSVDWLKSKYVSKAARAYIDVPYPKGLKISIPLRRAIFRLHSKDWVDRRLAALIKTNPYLQVRYEDLLKDTKLVTLSILRFLGCDSVDITLEGIGQRQSQARMSDYILNYEKLVQELECRDMLSARFDR